jgi:NhaA family Na+:H+ antiporter
MQNKTTQGHHLPIEKLTAPFKRFIHQEKSGGLVLGISVLIALILANSQLKESYHHFFEHSFGLFFDGNTYLNMSLHHWINDGLMAVFFFVVGLELKREIVAGELSNPRKALLPIIAAIGGMIIPGIIYIVLNNDPQVQHGWGIPMATDIAFALGVLYLLGNRIPLALKVFLTALAIVDDLGAVIVIALFYTSDISISFLLIGLLFLAIMFIGNKLGVRSILFYAILGICGVWMTFLLSGVHATIASVLAAFVIPSRVKFKELPYLNKVKREIKAFEEIDPNDAIPTLTNEQQEILQEINTATIDAMTPMQRLEQALHPFVTFLVIPIFAIANAGVSIIDIKAETLFNTNVALGVGLGLFLGKLIGVVGFTWLSIKIKLAPQPEGLSFMNLTGLGFLAGIGFTMSLFVTSLAFNHEEYMTQAKIGIFAASILSGVIGFFILKANNKLNSAK